MADAVRRCARRWSKEPGNSTAAAYVPLSFAPGEAYQFDWSHEVVLLNGVTGIEGRPCRACHSRMLFVRAYCCDTTETSLGFSRFVAPRLQHSEDFDLGKILKIATRGETPSGSISRTSLKKRAGTS